jgi:hypothetical protein
LNFSFSLLDVANEEIKKIYNNTYNGVVNLMLGGQSYGFRDINLDETARNYFENDLDTPALITYL